ncbi:hypothetical protein [Cellulosilyticum sp. I15G10I2]|uniref:hypothetical protein n=1 Tax=Cellulosilyticum sp. I15G10I2 TaxID=1892843 RepID=UPI00085C3E3C|nr:hypothetical protein [Cellulosilyticum sp. I15G10I2]
MDKHIYISNELVGKVLKNSSNASELIVEAILYFLDAIESGNMNQREVNRIFAKKLIKFE